MAEARDRLSRPDNVVEVVSRRQRSIASHGILADEPDVVGSATPFRWGSTAMTATRGQLGLAARRGAGRGIFGTPRAGIGRGRSILRSPAFDRENTPSGSRRQGRGRNSGSALPSWYPRRPLQDITAVVRAIERRRARLRETEGQEESPIFQDDRAENPSLPSPSAPLEHESSSMITPNPTARSKTLLHPKGIFPKILLDIHKENAVESGELTPQKKLLNSIDIVEKVVMEELRSLKRTPTAKKAEREKRVRTLMSMR